MSCIEFIAGDFNTVSRSFGSYLGIAKAFADEFQLDPKQYQLAYADDSKPERKEPCCVVHHPMPEGFVLLTVACFFGSILGTLLVCLWTGLL
jgi:hypothetical protein